jgi:hypothetical protein
LRPKRPKAEPLEEDPEASDEKCRSSHREDEVEAHTHKEIVDPIGAEHVDLSVGHLDDAHDA